MKWWDELVSTIAGYKLGQHSLTRPGPGLLSVLLTEAHRSVCIDFSLWLQELGIAKLARYSLDTGVKAQYSTVKMTVLLRVLWSPVWEVYATLVYCCSPQENKQNSNFNMLCLWRVFLQLETHPTVQIFAHMPVSIGEVRPIVSCSCTHLHQPED